MKDGEWIKGNDAQNGARPLPPSRARARARALSLGDEAEAPPRTPPLPSGANQPGARAAARRHLLATPGGCVLTDWYAGGDPGTPRPLALPRYEFYRTWLHEYSASSYVFLFDTRDTFFQVSTARARARAVVVVVVVVVSLVPRPSGERDAEDARRALALPRSIRSAPACSTARRRSTCTSSRRITSRRSATARSTTAGSSASAAPTLSNRSRRSPSRARARRSARGRASRGPSP